MVARDTVVVTGATGFIGNALFERLQSSGRRVVAIGRTRPKFMAPSSTWIKADLTHSSDALVEVIADAKAIVHLAWAGVPQSAEADPILDLQANVPATLKLADLACRAKCRFIFASSGGTVYGPTLNHPIPESQPCRPTSFYGLSKLTAELYLLQYQAARALDLMVLRFSNVYGEGQVGKESFGAIATFAEKAARGQEIILFGTGETIRDYIHVEDAVEAILAAIAETNVNGIMNIGSGVGNSLNDILRAIELSMGSTLRVRRGPPRSFDVPISVLDITHAIENLKWTPKISLEDGVARTLSAWQRTTLP